MKTIKLSIVAVATLILGLTSCKKEETITPTPSIVGNGSVSLELSHKFGMMNEPNISDWNTSYSSNERRYVNIL